MSSLVLELQRDALEKTVPTTDLLRKAMVVARKLRVTDIEQWISHELNGYPEGAEVPSYRYLRGEPKVFNPYNGWIPLMISDAKRAELFSKRGTSQSIAELENIALGDGDFVYMRYPKRTEQSLMKGMDIPMEPALVVSNSQVHGILDRVRNTVLEWALELEEKGIMGEGMSFTPDEKKEAGSVTVNLSNLGNIVGSMRDSQIQQGTNNSTQSYTKTLDLEAVRRVVDELKLRVNEAKLHGDDQGQFDSDISCVESQLKAPRPNPEIIRESLRSLRSVLEGIASSAAFQGIVTAIGALT